MVTKANEVYMNENEKETAAAFLSFFCRFCKMLHHFRKKTKTYSSIKVSFMTSLCLQPAA